jgi:lactoylglutathione lyase
MTKTSEGPRTGEKRLGYVIVFVSDMRRSVAFYRDVLHLSLRFESPCWSEFANEGTSLALHQAAASGGGGEQAGVCRLGFEVADIDAVHGELAARSVSCVSPPRTEGYGVRQALYRDPDGLVFTLAQPPAGTADEHGKWEAR